MRSKNPELILNVLQGGAILPHICIVSGRYGADGQAEKLLFHFQRRVGPKQISTKITF